MSNVCSNLDGNYLIFSRNVYTITTNSSCTSSAHFYVALDSIRSALEQTILGHRLPTRATI
jgi:hypothetical protein